LTRRVLYGYDADRGHRREHGRGQRLGEHVELTFSDDDHACSLVLTPRQARAIARQLLEQADAAEYGE
jgi:hypothetical protein